MTSHSDLQPTHANTTPSFATQLEKFDFRGDGIDMALRKLLAKVHLPKESQQIDRAMEDFAKRYHECNPGLVENPDAVYAVAFSILLLHTDAHNKNVRQKMNKETFIMRTKIIEGGESVPEEILDIMFDNIVYSEFSYAEGENDPFGTTKVAEKSTSWFAKLSKSDTALTSQTGALTADLYSKLDQLMPAESTYSYKRVLKPINITDIHLSLLKAPTICLAGVRSRHAGGGGSSQNSNNTYAVRVTKAGMLDRKYDLLQGGKKTTTRGWRPFGAWLDSYETADEEDEAGSPTRRRDNSHPIPSPHSRPVSPRPCHQHTSFTSISSASTTTQTITSLSSLYSSQSPTSSSVPSSPTSSSSSLLRPVQIISLANAICIYDEAYVKYPHVFRLITGDGQQFLMRAENDADMEDWMLKINYAATIKTTGIRLRPSRRLSSHNGLGDRREQRKLVEQARREEKAKAKVLELSESIANHMRSLDHDIQLRLNLMILVPLQKSTKDRILGFAETVGKRIQAKRYDLQRLECYRECMERELHWWLSTNPTRKMSAPLLSHPYAAPFVIQRSSTSPSPTPRKLEDLPFAHSHLTVSPHKMDEDIMWAHGHVQIPKRTSSLLKPEQLKIFPPHQRISQRHEVVAKEVPPKIETEKLDGEDDSDWNPRRASCPQIPPLPADTKAASSEDACEPSTSDNTEPEQHDRGDHLQAMEKTQLPLKSNIKMSSAAKVSEMDKLMRRRSRSNPIMPNDLLIRSTHASKLLDVPSGVINRERSGSEASSVRDDDDNMSVIMVNESEEDLTASLHSWTLTPAH
ncbi:hypothetical protein DFQ28_000501 [Apophysomyces sp. BC1034]|nr:hypothetical protein DFQ30_011174 [Apophysomyces sp. BC1015]KAG0167647.1 hypothetical protein DFQ29_000334 [Apophysomyces sp. BC1021]KAG0183908.1 hypothetical protein DFQ28_000501 [Apophysomyces sp. BC1034]